MPNDSDIPMPSAATEPDSVEELITLLISSCTSALQTYLSAFRARSPVGMKIAVRTIYLIADKLDSRRMQLRAQWANEAATQTQTTKGNT
jgi:hypothetical protein